MLASRLTRRARACLKSSRLTRELSTVKQSSGGFSFPAPRSLDQIVKLNLIENERPAAITQIWNEYHQDKSDCIARTLDGSTFTSIVERAQSAPYFVFPVHRQDGYFNMLSQFQDQYFLVTYLEAFKENPSLAPPCLTISLFDDLIDQKQLGLVRVDIVNMLDKLVSSVLGYTATVSDQVLYVGI